MENWPFRVISCVRLSLVWEFVFDCLFPRFDKLIHDKLIVNTLIPDYNRYNVFVMLILRLLSLEVSMWLSL